MLKLIFRSALAAMLLVTSFVPHQPAVSAPLAAPPEPDGLIQSLTAQAGGDLRLSYHRGTGQVNFIGGSAANPLFVAQPSAAALTGPTSAQQFLAAYGSLFGLTAPEQELTVKRDRTLDDGRAFVRYQQQYQGIPILGGELNIGLDAAQNVVSAGGEILPGIAVATEPVLDAGAAQQIALDLTANVYGLPAAGLQASVPELWIYNPVLLRADVRGATRLVWRLEVAPADLSDIRELVLVDAVSGKPALHFNQVDTAMNRMTYTANNGTTLPGSLLCSQADAVCGGDAHAAAAHLHAAQTYNYYLNVHNRDSIDGAGLTLISTVHYDASYVNAFWDGDQMVYGDGAGFPLADDVVAHELTHGVTQYESNLYYYYQSGAINESLSDIWGEFLDLTNGTGTDTPGSRWFMGEDVTGLPALRNMQDPTVNNDPDRMTSVHYDLGDGDYPNNDNGGVHTNSGVNNKAAYLLADGGTFNTITVSALGITKTAKLYYEVQTNLLTSGADYLDLYNALNQACQNLVGSVTTSGDCQEVLDATHAVEMNEEPTPGYNTDAALCSSNAIPVSSFYDPMETVNPAWTFGAAVGDNHWGYLTGYYAHSGNTALLGNDLPAAVTDSSAVLNPGIASLPANALLHFHHAYGFEQLLMFEFYDGGVLEYSTNGGTNWSDAGSLIQVNGYSGTLDNGFGNPLGGRNAFAGDSHGYISTRVNLASLQGQNVRFRWRMGLDTGFADFGWVVDDVRIYVCRTDLTNKLFVPLATR